MRRIPSPIAWFCRLVVAFTMTTVLRAEDAATPPRWTVIGECQMVTLPEKTALRLVPDLSDDSRIEAAWAQILQMIVRQKATLEANLVLRGAANQILGSFSTVEYPYPSHWDPPMFPDDIPSEWAVSILQSWPLIGPVLMVCEKREIGATFEMRAQVSEDGKWTRADTVAAHIRFLHFLQLDGEILPTGERLSIPQPVFTELKSTSALYLRSGQRVLLSLHRVPGQEGVMELFFLRVRAQRIGPEL